jgi:cellulose synthase/poly-beta-1,6-N-acetylglucosamine synthase-like glycosyltransferase
MPAAGGCSARKVRDEKRLRYDSAHERSKRPGAPTGQLVVGLVKIFEYRKFGIPTLRQPVEELLEAALPGGLVWDPHNLTEDADLGARLAAAGYRVDLLRR